MDQQLPSQLSDRRTTTIHIKKYRRVRASPSRTPPCRSVSTLSSRCDSIASDKVHDELKSMQPSLSIDSEYYPNFTQLMAYQSTPSGHAIPLPQQSSTVSSRSGSGNSKWSEPNSQSTADSSMTDMSSLTTPGSTFSLSDNSFHNSQYAAAHASSPLHSESLNLGTDKLSSRHIASGSLQHGGRRTLWIDTTIDGSASDICESPVDGDPRDDPPYSQVDYQMARMHHTGTAEHPESEIHGASLHSVTGRPQTCPGRLNAREISNTSDVALPSSLKDDDSERAPVLWCACHWLLERPIFASLEPGIIHKICRLYSRRMRNTPHTTFHRLQDKFEILWRKVCQAVPSLQSHVQQALSEILDIPPTMEDGLITLSLISAAQPLPSLHGYISLALFAKAWLSLEEQQGMADVTNGLFCEMVRCVTNMASSEAERDAYDLLLQLLWQPLISTTSPLGGHPLFCPVPPPPNISTSRAHSRAKIPSDISPILSHVCGEIVNVLIRKTKGALDSLSPSLRNTPTDPTVLVFRKICCLINLIHNSGDGALVIICPECSDAEFTGPFRARNLKKHLESDCSTTKKGPDYQRVSCPDCKQTFTRRDNVHQHMKRKHQDVKREQPLSP